MSAIPPDSNAMPHQLLKHYGLSCTLQQVNILMENGICLFLNAYKASMYENGWKQTVMI